jgi:FdhD protein
MNIVNVTPTRRVSLAGLKRNTFAVTSCGICGKAVLESVRRRIEPIRSSLAVGAEVIYGLPETLRRAQPLFSKTGGLHAAGVFETSGRLILLKEDVGRHNAVDKAVGDALIRERLPLDRHLLLVSGRASFEIIQKAAVARIPVVCAISAPSSLAVELAQELGMTLAGLVRGRTMNVYTGALRIRFGGRR